MKKPNEIIYTTDQVAKMLGYFDSSVLRRKIREGRIKADRFGSVYMIPESEVDKLRTIRRVSVDKNPKEVIK